MFAIEGILNMRKKDENFTIKRSGGFTLLELLVVIAIIMMLIGILVPGMQALKRLSKSLQQKSMFHSLEIGIELFSKDFGDYPESKRVKNSSDDIYYCGAQHLAEAMSGRDGAGYEPAQSNRWYWPGEAPAADDLYGTSAASLNRRKKSYIELKETGLYVPNEIYDTTVVTAGKVYSDSGDLLQASERAPVFTDVFLRKKITTIAGETVKVGSPILYYRADNSSRLFKKDGPDAGDDTNKWIYNYKDNVDLVDLGPIDADPAAAPAEEHLMKDEKVFYEMINNPGVSALAEGKPFNSSTYILMSAGSDGVFGTKDDVTNFDY